MKKVHTYIHPRRKPYAVCLTIGVQTFIVAERGNIEESRWFLKMLRTGLKNAGVNYSTRIPKRMQ